MGLLKGKTWESQVAREGVGKREMTVIARPVHAPVQVQIMIPYAGPVYTTRYKNKFYPLLLHILAQYPKWKHTTRNLAYPVTIPGLK